MYYLNLLLEVIKIILLIYLILITIINIIDMIKEIKLWYYRHFKIITLQQCYDFNLYFDSNIYGDEINYLNCRSVWADDKQRLYRCEELFETKYNYNFNKDLIYQWIGIFKSFNYREKQLEVIQYIEKQIKELHDNNINCYKEIQELNKLK